MSKLYSQQRGHMGLTRQGTTDAAAANTYATQHSATTVDDTQQIARYTAGVQ